MAKYKQRIKARQMRRTGESVKSIARKLSVSRSTASLWVRDIILRPGQLEILRKRELKGKERGRLLGALKQKEKRLQIVKEAREYGIKEFVTLKDREFFVAGLALYWGEGCRKTRAVQFCNSSPQLINFILGWFKRFFNVNFSGLTCRVDINRIHRAREEIIKRYWSEVTGIPLNRFRKTVLKKAKTQKIYENYNEYYGTFSVNVLKPARIYYKIIGLIEGLSEAGCRLASQGVS